MATERSALLLELIDTHRWERCVGMVVRLIVMDFVDRHGSVNNMWLDSL